MDTTDLSEASISYDLDRQIASICSKPAAGTVPLYRGYTLETILFKTTASVDGQDSAGYQLGSPIGYVYSSKSQKAPVQIYRHYKPGANNETRYLTTNIKNEGLNDGYKSFPVYWTMPLGPDTGLACNPIALYRKHSKNPVNGEIAHMDTTDLSEASSTFKLDRQIASICSKPAAGSVPLYRGFNPGTHRYHTTISLDGQDFAGYQLGSPIGYVYFSKNQEAPVQIYRNYNPGTNGGTRYLTTNIETEGLDDGYKSYPIYWTMPLGPDTGLACNPIALYRKHSKNPVNGEIAHMDTTDLSEASSTFKLDRQIASICSKPAAGSVPLYRGFNPGTHRYHTTISLDGQDFAGYQLGSPIGYVYFSKNKEASVQIYRNYMPGANGGTRYLTTNIETEGLDAGYKSFPVYWAMPPSATN